MNTSDHVQLMDTTLRDGEQTRDVSFSTSEKVSIAGALLSSLRVDRIEVASAAVSEGEKEAVTRIAEWAATGGCLERVEILSFMPHMHLRGTAALYEITYPDSRRETLLHVPNYAFNWQHTYQFAEPPQVPAGSKLRFTLWWDNSEDNPNNPDPTVDVVWGQPTDAEMSQGYMGFRTPQERRLVVGEPIPDDIVPAWYAGPLDPR